MPVNFGPSHSRSPGRSANSRGVSSPDVMRFTKISTRARATGEDRVSAPDESPRFAGRPLGIRHRDPRGSGGQPYDSVLSGRVAGERPAVRRDAEHPEARGDLDAFLQDRVQLRVRHHHRSNEFPALSPPRRPATAANVCWLLSPICRFSGCGRARIDPTALASEQRSHGEESPVSALGGLEGGLPEG